MSYVFKCLPANGKPNFLNLIDLEKMCIENSGVEMSVEFTVARGSPKQKLMSYYHKVCLPIAAKAFRNSGELCDEVEADFKLRCELAKMYRKDMNGEFVACLEDKRDMNKKRLHEYVSDCILFLETIFGEIVPDSQSYLLERKTGIKYTPVNTKK